MLLSLSGFINSAQEEGLTHPGWQAGVGGKCWAGGGISQEVRLSGAPNLT